MWTGGGSSKSAARDLTALITQLESGSNSAEAQLLGWLAETEFDNSPAGEFIDSADYPQRSEPDTDEEAEDTKPGRIRSMVLDGLARSAAAGSPYSLEVLLAAIVEFDLAGPAVGRVTQNAEHAMDIQQEILVNVARSIHRYRSESRFTTWLYVVARNIAVNHARKIRPTSNLGPDESFHDGARRRMSSLVAERDTVKDAIATLPDEFRTTVVLRDLEGLSYAEIAERQGLQINTVRSRLSRGRALLAERLRDQ